MTLALPPLAYLVLAIVCAVLSLACLALGLSIYAAAVEGDPDEIDYQFRGRE